MTMRFVRFDYFKRFCYVFFFGGWHDVFVAYDQGTKELLFFSLRSGELIRRLSDLPYELESMYLDDEGILKVRTNDGRHFRIDIPTGVTRVIETSAYVNPQSDPLNLRDKGIKSVKVKTLL